MLKTFKFTAFCVVLIWYLCLFKPPTLRIHTFGGFDKFTHITMYLGTCGVFWFEYFKHKLHWSKLRLGLVAVVTPILMSGIIELCQEYFTTYRSGDWYDLLANSFGVILALAGALIARPIKNKL